MDVSTPPQTRTRRCKNPPPPPHRHTHVPSVVRCCLRPRLWLQMNSLFQTVYVACVVFVFVVHAQTHTDTHTHTQQTKNCNTARLKWPQALHNGNVPKKIGGGGGECKSRHSSINIRTGVQTLTLTLTFIPCELYFNIAELICNLVERTNKGRSRAWWGVSVGEVSEHTPPQHVPRRKRWSKGTGMGSHNVLLLHSSVKVTHALVRQL